MGSATITGPDGKKATISWDDSQVTREEVQAKIADVQANWGKSSVPEQDPRITELQKPGAAQRMLRGVPGLGGFLDEIGAAGDAAVNYVTGGKSGEDYDTALARRRQAIKEDDAAHPIRNTVEGIVGGAATAAGLPAVNLFRGAAAAPSMARAGADAALTAAAYAAPTGFAEGEGGVSNRVANAVDYAKTAAPLGMVLGGAAQRSINRAQGTPMFGSVARNAQNIGVEVPQFMEGGTPASAFAGKMGAIPFIGDDINAAVAATRNQTANAAQNIASNIRNNPAQSAQNVANNIRGGAVPDPAGAGTAVRNALTNWADDGARAVQERVYRPVDQAFGNSAFDLNNTRNTVTQLAGEQYRAANPIHARAIAQVEEAVTRPQGMTFDGIRRLRTHVGRLIDDNLDTENRTARAGLQRVYGALTQDMENVVQQASIPEQRAWLRANGIARLVAQRRGDIAQVIGQNNAKSPEAIVDKIVSLAGTKGTADIARLDQVRRASGADAWRELAGAAINRLGRNQSNEFSADIFLKNFNQLSDEGRRILFGSFGNPQLLGQLNNLADVSRALQRFTRLGNPSGTGGVAALLTALGGAASGDMGATAATMLGGRLAGRVMARPAQVTNVPQNSIARQFLPQLNRSVPRQSGTAAANLARLLNK